MVYPNSSFDPVTSLEAISKYKCTVMHGVPTMFTNILSELEHKSYDVSGLRTGIMSGSVCPEPLIKKVFTNLNMHGLIIVYGMTELSPVAAMMGPDTPLIKKATTVGHAGPMTEIKLTDENG